VFHQQHDVGGRRLIVEEQDHLASLDARFAYLNPTSVGN
jgi:hypothetical protein